MRAADARKAHIVVHQELPGAVAIFGPGPLHIAVVVAVRRLRRDVEHTPVGHVPEQEVDIFPHFLGLVQRRNLDEAFLVGFAGDVAQLARVAATERDLAAAVRHFTADVEVLVDDEHPQAGVARPDGAWQAGSARADNDEVYLIVPLDAVGGGPLRGGLADAGAKRGRTDAGNRTLREEISAADGFGLLLLFRIAGALLGHAFFSLGSNVVVLVRWAKPILKRIMSQPYRLEKVVEEES